MTELQVSKTIGEEIRSKRKEVGLTQLMVATQAGLSRNYISDIESGRYTPSVDTLAKLARILNIDLNFLTKMTEIQGEKSHGFIHA